MLIYTKHKMYLLYLFHFIVFYVSQMNHMVKRPIMIVKTILLFVLCNED